MQFRIYGSLESTPSAEEITESLEESEFDVTIEAEEGDGGDEAWTSLLVYETSLEEPIPVFRYADDDDLEQDLAELTELLEDEENSKEKNAVLRQVGNSGVGYGVDLPDDLIEDDNAIVMCSLLAQFLAQKCSGFYTVDSGAFFSESGDLMYAMAVEEEE